MLKYVTSACAKNVKKIPAVKRNQSRRRYPPDLFPARNAQAPAERATADCTRSEKNWLFAEATAPVTPRISKPTRKTCTARTI